MKKSRFSEHQIAFALRQAGEGTSVAEVCRKAGISGASFHDQLFDGRNIRVLTIVDTFTRLSPAIDVRQHFRGSDVVETLRGLSQRSAVRQRSGSTHGPEFISKELDLWAFMRG
jgi:Transposase